MISIPTPNISNQAQAEFKRHQPEIIATTVARLLSTPGSFVTPGDQAERMLKSGFEFTSATLEACMQMNDASLLVEQLRWAKDRLPHDGISMPQMRNNLEVYGEVISEILPKAHAAEIVQMIQHLIRAQQEIAKE